MQQVKYQVTRTQLIGLIILAYCFSFGLRLIWIYQFHDNPNFFWNDQLMINTNDGYFFAAGAQKVLEGLHFDNPRIPDLWTYGLVFFTTLFVKFTPLSLETVLLYMPAVVSSLVVIPIIMIGRLYGQAILGFFAALLGSIAVSYYNRTMVGYYDTDMFSAMAPMFILFFLMKSTIDFNLKSAFYASLAIAVYPFLYDQGRAIVYAMGIIYAVYMVFYHRDEKITYSSLILVFMALIPLSLPTPFSYVIKIFLLASIFFILQRFIFEQKKLMVSAGIIFVVFLILGNVFNMILIKMSGYLATGTVEEGLHFYSVAQTVREAGKIPFEVFAERISGSQIGVLLALSGYVVLVIRHRAFVLALPLVGIGTFALWGGLRFTVYAVPIAALSSIFLVWIVAEQFIKQKVAKYGFIAAATALMLYPNITHIIDYKVPTVLNNSEVQDLVKLDAMASDKDYTLTWWDYGYPVWYYSDTSTLIDGGKHHNDNFIISTILQTSSQELAANLSRLAVETYVSSGHKIVADTLFKNKQKDQLNPNELLSELESGSYQLPSATRDIYLYLPYRMMSIFPTVAVFGNLDLQTGQPLRNIVFYQAVLRERKEAMLVLSNGIVFDAQKGELLLGRDKVKVKQFVMTENTKDGEIHLQSQNYFIDGDFTVLFLQSYGQFVVMDNETFNSIYVQMFMLGKYDPDLFEPVVTSPYSRIYRLKK